MEINKELLEEIKFDYNKPINDDDYYLYYKNEHLDLPIGVVGPGDLFLTYGREKTRKSSFIKGVQSAVFTDDPLINLGFSMDIGDKLVLDFDTEQSKAQWAKNQKKFHNSVGKGNNSDKYMSYHLRQFDYSERLSVINTIVQNATSSGKEIGFVFIDQIGDLVKDVNDEKSTKRAITNLLEIAEEHNCVVATVLHANRTAEKNSLGKLGSLTDKKCSSSWLIEYDNDTKVSCAKNIRARSLPVHDPVCFHHNEKGYVRLVGDEFKF